MNELESPLTRDEYEYDVLPEHTATENTEEATTSPTEPQQEGDVGTEGARAPGSNTTSSELTTLTRPRRTQKPMGYYAENGTDRMTTGKPQNPEDPCPRDPARGSIYIAESRLGPFRGAYARIQLAHRTKIATYTGQYKTDCENTHYVYHDAATSLTRDAWDHQLHRVRCLADFLNDPLDDTKANCRFIIQDRRYTM